MNSVERTGTRSSCFNLFTKRLVTDSILLKHPPPISLFGTPGDDRMSFLQTADTEEGGRTKNSH